MLDFEIKSLDAKKIFSTVFRFKINEVGGLASWVGTMLNAKRAKYWKWPR